MASAFVERLGGVLLTDQRSQSEAVMILWLESGTDSSLKAVLGSQAIVGAVHLRREEAGLAFDTTSIPCLSGPGGIIEPRQDGLSEGVAELIARIREHLKSRQEGASNLGPLTDHLSFFVFEKGEGALGPDWVLDYAGGTYPLQSASSGD